MEIAHGVHLLESTKGSYSYLVVGDEPVLVDTSIAGRAEKLLEDVRRAGLAPSDIAHIVLTHQDVDHIGNAKRLQELTKATLWAPAEEVPYIHGERRGHGVRRLIQTMMRVDRPCIDKTYEAGQKIGGMEVIPAPGHTPGHVCLRWEDVLLAGDLVTTRAGKLKPSPGFLTWDKDALRKSLQDVGRLSFDWVCPAHGTPVARGSLWDAFLMGV